MARELEKFLEHIAYNLCVSSILSTTQAGSGHPTSAMSAADLVAAIFFYGMQYDPNNPHNPNNDRFILSKGHAAPVLYAVWKELGVLTEDELMQLRTFDSVLEGHPTPRFSRVDVATGSLGQGLSIGIGMALSALMDNRSFRTYVLMGDSETSEGSVWEAMEIAGFYRLHNLIGIIDCNRLGQSTETIDGHDVSHYVNKCSAFGWRTFVINGHDMREIIEVLDAAKTVRDRPVMIIAKTLKGYGVDLVEDKPGYHGKPFTRDELPLVLNELKSRFESVIGKPEVTFWPLMPAEGNITSKSEKVEFIKPHYDGKEKFATRKAYGQALVALGEQSTSIISLDAEVKNSTYAQTFEEFFPDRFIQCFIAEQNMIGMAVGFAALKKIPFASTFGAFFTRAFDQIRMAAISRLPLRLVGSHAGVSIGQDGPSQMALEDIAMMRVIPHSVVLYPADAVATYALTTLAANNAHGITYIRTTREDTPVIYSNEEKFEVGGCKVLKQSDNDVACIIAAGITLYEALRAYEELKKENISIAIIDLYCIKPIDAQTISKVGTKSTNCIITVEDHYLEGGIGQAVCYELRNSGIDIECLAVEKLPHSGKPEELMQYENIDASAIIRLLKSKTEGVR